MCCKRPLSKVSSLLSARPTIATVVYRCVNYICMFDKPKVNKPFGV